MTDLARDREIEREREREREQERESEYGEWSSSSAVCAGTQGSPTGACQHQGQLGRGTAEHDTKAHGRDNQQEISMAEALNSCQE